MMFWLNEGASRAAIQYVYTLIKHLVWSLYISITCMNVVEVKEPTTYCRTDAQYNVNTYCCHRYIG